MPYQVLARKWRPQTFEEVVGQQGVTQTLRNAIASGRIGQAFIFAGARGVGKTTTARILAKALNCVNGPTVSPCNQCDACREIADGRDIDVLEIDAATHTQVEKVRDIIIEGLSLRPARDRYKIFIIDEVHMLSTSSFNALLKSVEEPPPHVKFIMATTELHKIPDTIRSRAQEFEFRTIATRAIADQLRKIAEGEKLAVEDAALQLVARSAEGSLRDAESAFDQVIAFAGGTIAASDVVTVLGLVGRDLLLDAVDTVAAEDAAGVFDVAGRAVEAGLDLRLVCRELARLVRDMMVVKIDPQRLHEPEFAPEGDLGRLEASAARFSREDLLRAFDILSKAEFEIRSSPQPRYHFEMALLKWIYARQLVPIAELIAAAEKGGAGPAGTRPGPPAASPGRGMPPSRPARSLEGELAGRAAFAPVLPPTLPPAAPPSVAPPAGAAPATRPAVAPPPAPVIVGSPAAASALNGAALKDALLEELRKTRRVFSQTVVAQAHRIEVDADTVTFGFLPQHRFLKAKLEQDRAAVEAVASQLAGRRVVVQSVDVALAERADTQSPADAERERLKQRALADSAVQAVLDVFPAEIRDVEEIKE